ncbi:carboxylesterase 4A-like [Sitophilus oryzae]|uniref:Carboxylesterase 4A-like n=1 Tax=Sitophilus oryzae TaxID=7048 RepID=A0A6J2YN70_SITOR|nr:carboxylesterase 4A-like [Sitophilus oryzae]
MYSKVVSLVFAACFSVALTNKYRENSEESFDRKESELSSSVFIEYKNPLIDISSGKIQGRVLETVDQQKVYFAFQGIPYAQPPVGNLRFSEPLPPINWNDTLLTVQDGPRCIQFISIAGSEDCLYLNVFTPKLPRKDVKEQNKDLLLPVMVWVYGGTFVNGEATVKSFSPDYLIEEDVIIVTFNYRVGVFGFLSTGDYAATGNWGLKDQILALKWVKENIQKFSGDPDKITLFGQSAGAACVSLLIQSPLATGLFHGAIMQSGSALNSWAHAQFPRKSAFAIGRLLDIKTNDSSVLIEQLRKIDHRTLQTTSTSTNLGETIFHNPLDGLVFAPTAEVHHPGAVFANKSHEALKDGNINRVPIIIGFNSQEAIPFVDVLKYLKPYLATYDLFATRLVTDSLNIKSFIIKLVLARLIRLKYFGLIPIVFSTSQLTQFVSDDQFVRPIYEYVRQSSKYNPAYFYIFSYEGPLGVDGKKRNQPGVGHSEDNNYLWNRDTNIKNPPTEDLLTRKRLVKFWTNFAKTANPTPEFDPILQNVTWSPTNIKGMVYLNISSNLQMNTDFSKYSIKFWNFIFNSYGEQPYDTY